MPAIPTPQKNTVVFASAIYSIVQVSAGIPVPADHDSFLVSAMRAGLPAVPGVVLRLRIELSIDAGLTWSRNPGGEIAWPWGPFPIEFSIGGGMAKDRSGTIVAASYTQLTFVPRAGQQLRIIFTPIVPVNTKIQMATAANGAVNPGPVT